MSKCLITLWEPKESADTFNGFI